MQLVLGQELIHPNTFFPPVHRFHLSPLHYNYFSGAQLLALSRILIFFYVFEGKGLMLLFFYEHIFTHLEYFKYSLRAAPSVCSTRLFKPFVLHSGPASSSLSFVSPHPLNIDWCVRLPWQTFRQQMRGTFSCNLHPV